jgi:hypothetical protein
MKDHLNKYGPEYFLVVYVIVFLSFVYWLSNLK